MQGSTLEESQLSVNYHQETVEHGHHGHPDHRLFGVVLFLVAESSIFFRLICRFLVLPYHVTRLAPRRHARIRINPTDN